MLKLRSKELRTIALLMALLVSGVVALMAYVVRVQEHLVRSAAIESASLYADALAEFRTIYTSEVVRVLQAHPDIQITHDYKGRPNAIPLPATLSMDLGERIGTHLSGAEINLYSPFPFPWRRETGGLSDAFRRDAWTALNQTPDQPYFRFTEYKGRPILRYAVADLMREDCVDCHNSHPQTPRNNWKVNDVRGVLEIIHPMDRVIGQVRSGTLGLYVLSAGVTLFGLISLTVLIVRFTRTTAELELMVAERTREVEVTQQKLTDAQKQVALGYVSAGIAHEINQPLGVMKLSFDSLNHAMEAEDRTKVVNLSTRLNRQVNRIDSIISQLDTFSWGGVMGDIKAVDINGMIRGAAEGIQEQFKAQGVALEVKLAKGMPHIQCAEVQMERVLINLMINALQAVELNEGPKLVQVSSRLDDDAVLIDVQDNGHGIAKEIEGKIFDPFFTTREVGKGSGLGLSLCLGIIRRFDGRITLTAGLDGGAGFRIHLPSKPVPTEAEP